MLMEGLMRVKTIYRPNFSPGGTTSRKHHNNSCEAERRFGVTRGRG
jgi:hypothetical protein